MFQKLKSAGFNGVSFYTDWALYEGEQGVYREEEILNLSKFIQAAKEAGIYLLAVGVQTRVELRLTHAAPWPLYQCRSFWWWLPRMAAAG